MKRNYNSENFTDYLPSANMILIVLIAMLAGAIVYRLMNQKDDVVETWKPKKFFKGVVKYTPAGIAGKAVDDNRKEIKKGAINYTPQGQLYKNRKKIHKEAEDLTW